jgi:hypothetical protein
MSHGDILAIYFLIGCIIGGIAFPQIIFLLYSFRPFPRPKKVKTREIQQAPKIVLPVYFSNAFKLTANQMALIKHRLLTE